MHYEEEENAYFKNTRKGGYDALNVYFFSKYSPGATSFCNWPTIIAERDDLTFGRDSCQLSAMTMPGFTDEFTPGKRIACSRHSSALGGSRNESDI